MSESEWMSSLMRPSKTLSAALALLGSWAVFLTILNLVIGAYSEGNKVLWIEFFTGTRDPSTTEMAFVMDDALFGLIGLLLIGLGARGLNKIHDSGFIGWLIGLPGCITEGLLSSKSGARRMIASWLVAIGVLFYFLWSAMENTWVDPGVYSVAAVLVSFGVGIGLLEEAEG